MGFFGRNIFLGLAMGVSVLAVSPCSADSPNSMPVDAPLTLHESINAKGSDNDPDCVKPAPYSYDDVYGVVDCNPIKRGECDWDMVCYYRRTKSCFPPETKIQMGNGTTKQIEDVRTGDKVWNPVKGREMTVGRMLRGPEKIPLVEIRYGTTVVHVTQKHPMVVEKANLETAFVRTSLRIQENQITSNDFSVKRADSVSTQDRVLGADGKFHRVESVKLLPVVEGQIVYNFEVVTESNDVSERMIAADGMVTGDVVVQADLNGDRLPWEK